MENIKFQRNLTRLILAEIEEYGFVLCGSAAIREHGLIRRPTEDVSDGRKEARPTNEVAARLSHNNRTATSDLSTLLAAYQRSQRAFPAMSRKPHPALVAVLNRITRDSAVGK